MKTKKFNKKLSLRKQTIANIANDDMSVLRGGGTIIEETCFTCEDTCRTCPTCGTCGTFCNGSCPHFTICA